MGCVGMIPEKQETLYPHEWLLQNKVAISISLFVIAVMAVVIVNVAASVVLAMASQNLDTTSMQCSTETSYPAFSIWMWVVAGIVFALAMVIHYDII